MILKIWITHIRLSFWKSSKPSKGERCWCRIGLREKYDISRLAPILRKGIGYEEQIELVTLLGKKRKDLYHFLKISTIEKSPSCDIPIYQIHITFSFSLFEKVQTSVLLILWHEQDIQCSRLDTIGKYFTIGSNISKPKDKIF